MIMTHYYLLGAGYATIAMLAFIFSGVFGVSPNEKSFDVGLGALLWPLIGLGILGDLADNLRISIAQKTLDRANRPKKVKVRAPTVEKDESELHDMESCYREMDCKLCGHTLALKKSAR